MSDVRHRLTVIPGDGKTSAALRTHLSALHPIQTPSEQLPLPLSVSSDRTIVSVGVEAENAETLAALVTSLRVTKICDVRVSPSFRSRGGGYLTPEAFARLTGVPYRHLGALANRHSGVSWNGFVALDRYAAELLLNPDPVRAIGDLIGGGPIALVGRARTHEESERTVICNLLQRLGYQFDLLVCSPICSELNAR